MMGRMAATWRPSLDLWCLCSLRRRVCAGTLGHRWDRPVEEPPDLDEQRPRRSWRKVSGAWYSGQKNVGSSSHTREAGTWHRLWPVGNAGEDLPAAGEGIVYNMKKLLSTLSLILLERPLAKSGHLALEIAHAG
ncbi:hypothetical protein STEG23_036057 [Scotinomys teguina]